MDSLGNALLGRRWGAVTSRSRTRACTTSGDGRLGGVDSGSRVESVSVVKSSSDDTLGRASANGVSESTVTSWSRLATAVAWSTAKSWRSAVGWSRLNRDCRSRRYSGHSRRSRGWAGNWCGGRRASNRCGRRRTGSAVCVSCRGNWR